MIIWRDLIKKAVRPLAKPLLRQIARGLSDDDVWSRTEEAIPAKRFGAGNVHDWNWYLEGKSTVDVNSPKEIVDWLRGCRYIDNTEDDGRL